MSGVNEQIVDEIAKRFFLSIGTGLFWLGLIFIVLRMLRIKNASVVYLFLIIPLAKSLMAVVRQTPEIHDFNGIFIITGQIPNLAGMLPVPPWDTLNYRLASFYEPTTSISTIALLMIVVGAVGFFVWRLWGLIKFQRIINHGTPLDRNGNQGLFESLDRFVDETKIPYPKVILLDTAETPFTVGIKRPIIAFSQDIIDKLSNEEIEAALAHEVAHIARKDYLFHWPVLIIRDLLFFNPLSYFLYRRLSFERERACDNLGSKFCRPQNLAKCLVKIAEIQKHKPSSSIVKSFAPQNLLTKKSSYFGRRVRGLIEPSALKLTSKYLWLVMIAFLIFVFFMEIHLIVSISGNTLILS